jgi:ADP-heptose:LPS heptosyltransferase
MRLNGSQRWGRWGIRRRILAWKNVVAFAIHGRSPRPSRGTKIAIFKPDRLGDFVLALGAIRWIVRKFGETECVLFISRYGEELARREFPNVARVVVHPFADELWPAWRQFRSSARDSWWAHEFGTAISLRHQRSAWQELLFGRLRCRDRWAVAIQGLGYHPIEYRWIATRVRQTVDFPTEREAGVCQELTAHRRLINAAFGATETLLPFLSQPLNPVRTGALLICPFGSASIRTLPAESMAVALKEFLRSHPMPLRMAAMPAELNRYQEYADALVKLGLSRPEVAPTPSVESLIAELSGCRVVLSTESATAHFAIALDQPMVALLGGGHHGIFAPWRRSPRQIWLDHRTDCYYCDWHCIHPEPYCLTRISPGAIAQALSKVLCEVESSPVRAS